MRQAADSNGQGAADATALPTFRSAALAQRPAWSVTQKQEKMKAADRIVRVWRVHALRATGPRTCRPCRLQQDTSESRNMASTPSSALLGRHGSGEANTHTPRPQCGK
ncbi:hypothetical protein TcCL_NonESM10652 [Trypanosoma cruzi]|nr:hypothetical protein TcCL_NonESM10652 [Trypanosoma cruzi]